MLIIIGIFLIGVARFFDISAGYALGENDSLGGLLIGGFLGTLFFVAGLALLLY